MPLRERAKQTESEKVKKKTFVFLRVKGIYHFFNFERKQRLTMGHYFGNHGKKAMAMATKIFVTQSTLPKSITKNKMSDKTKERKKEKGKKESAVEYFEC